MLAEQIVKTMAAQCMLWQTSPAATEIEGVMIDRLRQALALPQGFAGVIQDSASSATLSAVLTMRERALAFCGNREGLSGKGRVRVYCSEQAHSSVDRAVWVAGLGQDTLVELPTRGPHDAMDAQALRLPIAHCPRPGRTAARFGSHANTWQQASMASRTIRNGRSRWVAGFAR